MGVIESPQSFWLRNLDGSRFNDWVFESFAAELGPRVLEVGCGIGTYTQRIAAKASRVLAIDIDPEFTTAAKAAVPSNVEVRCMDATQATWDEQFDTAVMLDVIEHLDDDVGMLRSVAGALAPNGRAIVKVPAYPVLHGKMDDAVGHRRRYTNKSITEAMQAAGLASVRTWPFNFAPIPMWWLNGKVLKRSTPPSEQVGAFDALVPALRLIEKHLPVPFGLSLFAVGVKP